VQGEKAQEYADICPAVAFGSKPLDAAKGQIQHPPQGRHIEPKVSCRDNKSLRRAFLPDMFAILTPQSCW
jgi:hypothetical protein